jgi:dihydrofolate reductase
VTIDGLCDHMHAIADKEHHHYAVELIAASGALVLGRRTYELFESYWPHVSANPKSPADHIDLGRRLDAIPKFVVSKSLASSSWEKTVILSGDVKAETSTLKNQLGDDLLIFGSPSLLVTLTNLDLIDEYQIVDEERQTWQNQASMRKAPRRARESRSPAVTGKRRWRMHGCAPGSGDPKGDPQRQLQAWPLHRRGDCPSLVAEAANSRGHGAD